MRQRLAPILFDEHDPVGRDAQRTSPVAKATSSPAARRKAAGKCTDPADGEPNVSHVKALRSKVGKVQPNKSGGLMSAQSVAASMKAATSIRRRSLYQGATSCNPTGSPPRVKPQGTETAGLPVMLNG